MDVVSLGKDSKVNQFDPRAGGARSMIIDDHRQRCGRRGSGEGQRGGEGGVRGRWGLRDRLMKAGGKKAAKP